MVRAQWHQKTSWRLPGDDPELNWRLFKRNGCGLPLEAGANSIDVVAWYLGRFPKRVRASGAILAWSDGRETPDTVAAELAFDGAIRLDCIAAR